MRTDDWQISSFCAEGNGCVGLSAAAPDWQVSSHCGEGNACVGLSADDSGRRHRTTIRLRESDDPGQVLATTPARMRALLAAVKRGEFVPAD